MIKLLVVLMIAVIIFILVYLSSGGNTKTAAILAGLATALAFAGPYIVNLVETEESNTETMQENANPVDASTDFNDKNSFDNKEKSDQTTQTENSSFTKKSTSTFDLELSIDKIADVNKEIQGIESKVLENTGAQIDEIGRAHV